MTTAAAVEEVARCSHEGAVRGGKKGEAGGESVEADGKTPGRKGGVEKAARDDAETTEAGSAPDWRRWSEDPNP